MKDKLRIGIIGYGKMGQLIERFVTERGHEVAFIAERNASAWHTADVAIDFTRPESARPNIKKALEQRLPLVIGTTGWHDQVEEVKAEVANQEGSLLYASNFSLGVNLYFALNERLSQLMDQQDYRAHVKEIHHLEKLDSPSGTAISIAQGIIANHGAYSEWKLDSSETKGTLGVTAERLPKVPGTHVVTWENEIDRISISHEAKNRNGFALGAVLAAEWLRGKQGLYTMQDVLKTQ